MCCYYLNGTVGYFWFYFKITFDRSLMREMLGGSMKIAGRFMTLEKTLLRNAAQVVIHKTEFH
jgi:hypothetical protein